MGRKESREEWAVRPLYLQYYFIDSHNEHNERTMAFPGSGSPS